MKTTVAALAIVVFAATLSALPQTRDKGVTATTILENDTVRVGRVRLPPHTALVVTATAPPAVLMQITAGEVEVDQPGEGSRGLREPGAATYVPSGVGHRSLNIGQTTFELMLISIKPSRAPAPAAPKSDAPPGISRTAVIDNDEVRVVRARFATSGREPVHAHPNDLLTIQISGGNVEIVNGSDRSSVDREPGFLQFLPRNVLHAFASADTQPFEILSISIK